MKLAILALLASAAEAGTVAVSASNFGFYNNAGTFASGTNHAVGYYTGTPPGELRNFFVFDLTGLAGKITAARLRAYNNSNPIGFSSPQGTETYTLFDVSTPTATLTGLTGGVAAFNDLGTGTPLGSVTVTDSSMGTIVEVNFNAQGIAYLNSANGKIAVGGALTTLSYGAEGEFLFNAGTGNVVRELVVTTQDNPVSCSFTLSNSSAIVAAAGSTVSVLLNNNAGNNCQWQVGNSASWISPSTISGTGSATVNLAIAANPSTVDRSATLTIAGVPFTVTQTGQTAVSSTALRFVSMPPCRLMETRNAYNFEGRQLPFGPPFLNGNETRTLTPSASTICQIPSSAKAFVFNVTLVPRGPGVDYVTVYPAGEARPDFWTVRSPDGLIVANSAIVKAGTAGAISVFTPTATDLLIDIAGYFTDDASLSNLVYYPLTPCRVVETRAAYRPQTGPFGPPSLPAKQARNFRFPQSPNCQIPSGAAAYSVTITVVPPAPLPFLTAWPAGAPQPNVSSINSPNGRILANSVIVPASADGSISLLAFETTDAIVDINGYFAPDNGNGLYFYPLTQCRVSNTMDGSLSGAFGGPIFQDQTTRTIPVLSSIRCSGIPGSAKAYAVNTTVVPNGNAMPFLTVWPTGQGQPNASVINAFEGQTVSSGFIVPAGTNGSIDVFAYRRTHVVMEIAGYFGR